jgi:hypothetical protein
MFGTVRAGEVAFGRNDQLAEEGGVAGAPVHSGKALSSFKAAGHESCFACIFIAFEYID